MIGINSGLAYHAIPTFIQSKIRRLRRLTRFGYISYHTAVIFVIADARCSHWTVDSPRSRAWSNTHLLPTRQRNLSVWYGSSSDVQAHNFGIISGCSSTRYRPHCLNPPRLSWYSQNLYPPCCCLSRNLDPLLINHQLTSEALTASISFALLLLQTISFI